MSKKTMHRLILAQRRFKSHIDLKRILSPKDLAQLEAMAHSGELMSHSFLKDFTRRKWSSAREDERESLSFTKSAVALWIELDEPETRLLVANCARSEWGPEVHIEFNADTRSVTFEHFDGRRETIGVKQVA